MRHIFIVLLLCLGFAASAFADGRAFPPDDCSAATPFMAFNGVATAGNTYCNSGQAVMHHAIPDCVDGQKVIRQNGKFVCADDPAPCNTLPSGAACTNTTYVTSASSVCNYPGENVHSMVWKTIDTFRCNDGTLTQLGHFSGEGACSNLQPGQTITVNECPD